MRLYKNGNMKDVVDITCKLILGLIVDFSKQEDICEIEVFKALLLIVRKTDRFQPHLTSMNVDCSEFYKGNGKKKN